MKMLSPQKSLELRITFNGCLATFITSNYVDPLWDCPTGPLSKAQFRIYIDRILDMAIDYAEGEFYNDLVTMVIEMRDQYAKGTTEADVHDFFSSELPFHLIRTDHWMRQGLKNWLLSDYGIEEGMDFLA